MQHLQRIEEVQLERPSVVTIGVFDGVHRGHQHLIGRLVEQAHAQGRLAVVLTFFPHPDVVIKGIADRYYLTTDAQRAALLGGLGVDYVITLQFDDHLRQIRAARFVDLMKAHLKLETLWVGSDFAMGHRREGNVDFLRAQGVEKDFTLQVIDLIMGNHSAISSTSIRQALQDGDVEQARDWLGRAYSVRGEVVHGLQRGHTIGFPTANIDVWNMQVIPANGVYAGWAILNGRRHMAVTNVGTRPTFNGDNTTVEAHLLDFDQDIYGEQLEFTFETRLRPETRFDGIQALIAQIGADAEQARRHLESQS